MSAAEAGGLDSSDPNAEVDLDSLTGYLTRGYKNLNPNATDEEVFQFVQENTAEYRAMGGRIGYASGSDKKMMIVDMLNKGMDFDLIKKLTKASDKEMGEAIDFFKYGGAGVPLPTFDESGKMIDDGLYKGRETRPEAKANGGRISYAMGTDEKVEMAAGIEGLPVRQNKAGVKELDLRETGGFIQPVGIKEKADDIPAMLSNNEFVFTADAVRAAGGGNINKGAQVMYDTMKKLESKVV